MTHEAIILAGGQAFRLKPELWIPKPLLSLNGNTLLERQVNWLQGSGFEKIVLAIDKSTMEHEKWDDVTLLGNIVFSTEQDHLGTGGAIKKAVENIDSRFVYVMNVDDLVSYQPITLYAYADRGGSILLSKPRLPFGRVYQRNSLVTRFEQKPTLDFYVSTGHYCFKKKIIEKYFPDQGDFEVTTMQRLTDTKCLRAMKYCGIWITINTYKDYLYAKGMIEAL